MSIPKKDSKPNGGRRQPKVPDPNKKEYAVGYGKPPVANQFAKGTSGRPEGRPKGARNKQPAANDARWSAVFKQEGARPVLINEGGKQVKVPSFQAVVRSTHVSALKGNPAAQKLVIDANRHINAMEEADSRFVMESAVEYKIWAKAREDEEDALGIPHPPGRMRSDEIHIDHVTGDILVDWSTVNLFELRQRGRNESQRDLDDLLRRRRNKDQLSADEKAQIVFLPKLIKMLNELIGAPAKPKL